MPLYEYECDACATRFERIQKFTDPPPAACPKCGGTVHKLMSSPAIQFKGSGFYITDYARKGETESSGSKDKEKSSSSDHKDSGSKDSSSKDSKSSDTSSKDSSSSSASSTPAASAPASTSGGSTSTSSSDKS